MNNGNITNNDLYVNQLLTVLVPPPGEILNEEMEYRCITQQKLAAQTDLQYSVRYAIFFSIFAPFNFTVNMRKFNFLFLCFLLPSALLAQVPQASISNMSWGADYKLHVKLANDSAYVVDVKALYHADGKLFVDTADMAATYYPVALDDEFVNYIKSKNLLSADTQLHDTVSTGNYHTLWSSIHAAIGGAYIHFVNCLVYALEWDTLMLRGPIFKRPVTDWRPDPMTQSFRRTRKWTFYYPSTQKLAKREYRLRRSEGDLADLHGVPNSFIDLFLNTSESRYQRMRKEGKVNQVAQIDLVRILLGAKYLGDAQIRSITNSVTSAVLHYSRRTMPSIIIFDDYKAAVAMSLERDGYKIDRIVYSDGEVAGRRELDGRTELIEKLIKTINEANERVFQKRLGVYYQQ